MGQVLSDAKEAIETFVAISGLVGASYAFFTNEQSRADHHVGLTGLLEKLTHGSFLNLLRGGVGRALGIVSSLYGPPKSSEKGWAARYLTLNAWRVSAWISSVYIFVFAPFIGFSLLLMNQLREPLGKASVGAYLIAFSSLVAVFLVQLRLFRTVRDGGGRRSAVAGVFGFSAQTGHVTCAVVAFFAFGALTRLPSVQAQVQDQGPLMWVWFIAFMIGLPTLLVAWVLKNISIFNFYAPVAMIAEIFVSGLVTGGLSLGFVAVVCVILRQDLGVPAILGAKWLGLLILLVSAGACVLFMIIHAMRFKSIAGKLQWISFASMIVGAALCLPFLLSANVSNKGKEVVDLFVFVFSMVAPYIIALYGVVFANSFPDWLSVAFSRYLLEKAANSQSFLVFVPLIFFDLIVAVSCIALSFVVLLFSSFVIFKIFDLLAVVGQRDQMALEYRAWGMAFFGGPRELLMVARDVVAGRPGVAVETIGGIMRGTTLEASGARAVVIASSVGLPALIPTAINFLVLTTLTAGRLFGLTVLPGVNRVHRMLFVPDGAAPRDVDEARRKSSIVIVFLVVVALITVLKLADWALKTGAA